MGRLPLIAAGVLALAIPLRAEDHPEMRAAENDLRSAKQHLEAAAHDYGGHRKQAIESIDHALGHIREGLESVEGKEKKVEHKEQRLEHKEQKLERRDERMKE